MTHFIKHQFLLAVVGVSINICPVDSRLLNISAQFSHINICITVLLTKILCYKLHFLELNL